MFGATAQANSTRSLHLDGAAAPTEGEVLSELSPWSGGTFSPFELGQLDGGRIALDALRGRVVIMNFFATWCPPCVKEFASLNMLAAATSKSRVKVIAINYGEGVERVRRFASALPLTFPIALDADKSVSKSWDVYTLPTTYVLDRDLMIRFAAVGEVDWVAPQVVMTIKLLLGDASPQRT